MHYSRISAQNRTHATSRDACSVGLRVSASLCRSCNCECGCTPACTSPIPADVRRLTVHNQGWELVPLAPGEVAADAIKIRGFKLVKHDARVLTFDAPGDYVVDEA